MHRVGHIVALAPPRDEMDAVQAALAVAGVHAEVIEPQPGVYGLADESFHEHVRAGRQGLRIGALLGALLGLAIITLVPVVRDLPAIARLLLLAGIALQGSVPGMMWRMGRVDHYDDYPDRAQQVTAADRLVIIDDEHDEPRARHVLERHHVTMLRDDVPV